MKTTTDKYGRKWQLSPRELCEKCGQPDSLNECNHRKLTVRDVLELEGTPRHDEVFQFDVLFRAETKRVVWAADEKCALDVAEDLADELPIGESAEDWWTWDVVRARRIVARRKRSKKPLRKKRK